MGASLFAASCGLLIGLEQPNLTEPNDASAETSSLDGGSECGVPAPDDPKNCGSCNHDCLGGTCEGGMCQPVVLTNQTQSPYRITVAGNYVYWTEITSPGRIVRCPITGCSAPEEIIG